MIKAYPDYKFEMSPNCPVCGGAGEFEIAVKSNEEGKKFIIQLFSCTQCGTAYHNPRMSREALNKYYGSGQYRSERMGKDKDIEKKIFTANKRIQVMKDWFGIEPKRFLDVGCGLGLIVKRMKDAYGCEAVGYDIYPHPEAEVPIVTEREKVEGKFDLIFCIHLLEHLYDPVKMMEWLESKLADDGLLYMEIPLRRQLLVAHPFLFSMRAIGMMIDHVGLKGLVFDYMKDVAVIFAHRGTRWNPPELNRKLGDEMSKAMLGIDLGLIESVDKERIAA